MLGASLVRSQNDLGGWPASLRIGKLRDGAAEIEVIPRATVRPEDASRESFELVVEHLPLGRRFERDAATQKRQDHSMHCGGHVARTCAGLSWLAL